MTEDEKYFARDFREILEEFRGGMCLQELTEGLMVVTKACRETGKSGSITLTLKVSPQGSNQAIVSDDIKSKVPTHSVQPTIMFVSDDNNLVRNNPKQMNISDAIQVKEDGETITVDKNSGVVIVDK